MSHRGIWLSAALTVAMAFEGARAAEPVIAPPVTALAVAPDGKTVLAGSQAGLRQVSYPELKPQDSRKGGGVKNGTLKTALPHVHDLAFSPRGDFLAVGGGAPAEAGMVEVISWPEGKLAYRAEPQGDLIYAVAWSPDGRQLATASYDHTVAILDASSGKRLHKLQGHSRGVLAVCYLPDGKTLVSAGADNSVRVWDVENGRPVRTLDNHTAAVHDLAVRPGEAKEAPPLLASASDDRTVRLWQPTIGRMVRFARLPSARSLWPGRATAGGSSSRAPMATCDRSIRKRSMCCRRSRP